jgi:hypothetical protein
MAVFPVEGGPSSRGSSSLTPAHSKPGPGPGQRINPLRRGGEHSVEHFPEIISRLPGMAGRFATTLDRADIGFLPDGILDELPRPARTGATRTGGIGPQRL